KVFGPDAILNDPYFDKPKDKRVYKITVWHLLSHKGGWSQRWGDQMFMPSVIAHEMNVDQPVDLKTIIRFALNKNLHFTPGTGRSYSNLGYSILGLVIERVSGMPYEEYCRKNIFEPLGMYDMLMAGNMPSERAPYEVTYYQSSNVPLKPSIYGTGELLPPAYGGNDIRTLGAAGGWIATAPDLMRLLLAVDGFDSPPDILTRESINLMTDAYNGFAPMGWKTVVVNGTWWRTGSFPGTAGMLKRQPDGFAWVVLLNSSSWNGPEINTYVNAMMSKVVSQMNRDFDYDLFEFSMPVPLTVQLKPESIVKTECASP
ncbi:MAG: beta-lactamase family protein, partial [Bacteroidales bacterium]|nr:beta-lactamase family protein [Bacteroidales bacterium]